MKIAIIGQQDFGKAVLEAFLARGDQVAAVFCAPEKEGARADALRTAAEERGVKVHQFKSLRAPEAIQAMKEMNLKPNTFYRLKQEYEAGKLPYWFAYLGGGNILTDMIKQKGKYGEAKESIILQMKIGI